MKTLFVASALVLTVVVGTATRTDPPARQPQPAERRQAEARQGTPGGPVIASLALVPQRIDGDGVCRDWLLTGTATDAAGNTLADGAANFYGQAPVNGATSWIRGDGRFGLHFYYGAQTTGYADPRPTTFVAQVTDGQGRLSAPASVVLP